MTHKKNAAPATGAAPHTSQTNRPIISKARILEKRISTLQAQLALGGFTVRDCDGGGWFVSSPTLAFFARDYDDLAAIAAEVGQ